MTKPQTNNKSNNNNNFHSILLQQTRRMGDGAWDVNSIAEAEFEKVLAVYIVPDQPYDESSTGSTVKRAEGTLPRNLVLKPTQAHGQPHNVSCFKVG